jgi:hypothetical protein
VCSLSLKHVGGSAPTPPGLRQIRTWCQVNKVTRHMRRGRTSRRPGAFGRCTRLASVQAPRALWPCGPVALWPCGPVALWPCGSVPCAVCRVPCAVCRVPCADESHRNDVAHSSVDACETQQNVVARTPVNHQPERGGRVVPQAALACQTSASAEGPGGVGAEPPTCFRDSEHTGPCQTRGRGAEPPGAQRQPNLPNTPAGYVLLQASMCSFKLQGFRARRDRSRRGRRMGSVRWRPGARRLPGRFGSGRRLPGDGADPGARSARPRRQPRRRQLGRGPSL